MKQTRRPNIQQLILFYVVMNKSTSIEGIRITDPQFALSTEQIGNSHQLLRIGALFFYQHYILPLQVKLRPGDMGHGQLNCYGSRLGYNCIIELSIHPVPISAPNVTDKSTSTEGIRTMYPQCECPSALQI